MFRKQLIAESVAPETLPFDQASKQMANGLIEMVPCRLMAYPPTAVANAFLDLSRNSHEALDPMKVQKLVYFAHGWHLGRGAGPLISEPIEAWDYGPVVPTLYRDLKPYGAGAITEHLKEFEPTPGGFRFVAPAVTDATERSFLGRIWEVYGKLSATQLSAMTHQPGTPWTTTRNRNPGARGAVIPDELMKIYFQQLAATNARRLAAPSASR
jgi:uncharacterized phage-associated protein